MKLSRLYSNDIRFHSIKFNDGLNVVIGKVTNRNEMGKDSHNLGKSTLVSLIDFMLLKGEDKNFFLKKYERLFINHVFYLEILLNSGKYLTIRRTVVNPTKISFKLSEIPILCGEMSTWTESDMPIEKARNYLNNALNFNVLTFWKYRKFLTFFLRTQRDYADVFQLSKFSVGKHRNWKPAVFDLLGYNSRPVRKKYDLEDNITTLEQQRKVLCKNMSVSPDDYDKLKSTLEIRGVERDEMREKIDSFNFYSEERKINRKLVENTERKIADLNSKEYVLTFSLEKARTSLRNIPEFDIAQLKKLYEEVGVILPNHLMHSYSELLQFATDATKERNKYLRAQMEDINDKLKTIREQLIILNNNRDTELSILQDKDTFRKFKTYEKRLAELEGEIANLNDQLKRIEDINSINTEIDNINHEIKNVRKQINKAKDNESETSLSIKRHFNEIFRSIFDVSAVIYVRVNSLGNIDFYTEIIPDENSEATAEGLGSSYKKIMCFAFDLAVLSAYSGKSFYRFVYHDGIFEGLDNRKKELFVQTVRKYCNTYGLQYIFSSIEDDIPDDILASFSEEEECLILSDENDEGRLFGFSY